MNRREEKIESVAFEKIFYVISDLYEWGGVRASRVFKEKELL